MTIPIQQKVCECFMPMPILMKPSDTSPKHLHTALFVDVGRQKIAFITGARVVSLFS